MAAASQPEPPAYVPPQTSDSFQRQVSVTSLGIPPVPVDPVVSSPALLEPPKQSGTIHALLLPNPWTTMRGSGRLRCGVRSPGREEQQQEDPHEMPSFLRVS